MHRSCRLLFPLVLAAWPHSAVGSHRARTPPSRCDGRRSPGSRARGTTRSRIAAGSRSAASSSTSPRAASGAPSAGCGTSRAHASSHFVVSRVGPDRPARPPLRRRLARRQRRVNARVDRDRARGLERTTRPGFTEAQYRASARLTAWLARRSLLPIDRVAPDRPRAGARPARRARRRQPPHRSGAVLELARVPAPRPPLRGGPGDAAGRSTRSHRARCAGSSGGGAETAGGVRRVEFAVDGRVVWTDARAPFAFAGGRGLNTTIARQRRPRRSSCAPTGTGRGTTSRAATSSSATTSST